MIRINAETFNKPVYLDTFKKFIGGFVPLWIMRRKELSTGAKLIYGALFRHAGKNGKCWMSQKLLAKELGVHRDTVGRWIKELKKYKLIEAKPRAEGSTYLYRFLYKPGWIQKGDLRKGVEIKDLISESLSEATVELPEEDTEVTQYEDTTDIPDEDTVDSQDIIRESIEREKRERDTFPHSPRKIFNISDDNISEFISYLDEISSSNKNIDGRACEQEFNMENISENIKNHELFLLRFWNLLSKRNNVQTIREPENVIYPEKILSIINKYGVIKIAIEIYNYRKLKPSMDGNQLLLPEDHSLKTVLDLHHIINFFREMAKNEKKN